MEYFDVVNEEDEVIGKATREECHSNPALIHHTVHFTLADKKHKKILITQRSFNKRGDPGKICFAGEHILAGESYENGLLRGVKEEFGFTPKKVKELLTHIFRYNNQTVLVKFFIAYWDGEKINFDSQEIIKIDWYPPNKLIKNIKTYSDITRYWVENINWKKVLI